MRFKICALFLIVVVSAQTAWAQGGLDGQWRRVQALNRGEQVKIKRLDKKTVEGAVVTVTSDEFTASVKGGMVTIPRSDIREVKVRSAEQQQQNAFVGAAIGGMSGVATAAILDGALTDGNGISGGAAVFLGAVGAAAGLVIRMLRPAYRTIYKAPR